MEYAALQSYVRSLTFDQSIAHLEFLGTSIFFAAKKSYKGFKKVDWEWLADALSFDKLKAIASIPLSMKWLSKDATFSRQKYASVRSQLEGLGILSFEKSAPRRGPQQPITELHSLNCRSIVELIREIIEWMGTIVAAPEEHPLWPRHGFAFLFRWHLGVFGFDPRDRDRVEEMMDLALYDRDTFWKRTLHGDEWEAYARKVESGVLHNQGWSEESKEDIELQLKYPYSYWDAGKDYAQSCPSISRLSIAETEFLDDARYVARSLRSDYFERDADFWVGNTELIIANRDRILEVVLDAIAYCEDPTNGTGVGRPIAHAHAWIMELVAEKLTGFPRSQRRKLERKSPNLDRVRFLKQLDDRRWDRGEEWQQVPMLRNPID